MVWLTGACLVQTYAMRSYYLKLQVYTQVFGPLCIVFKILIMSWNYHYDLKQPEINVCKRWRMVAVCSEIGSGMSIYCRAIFASLQNLPLLSSLLTQIYWSTMLVTLHVLDKTRSHPTSRCRLRMLSMDTKLALAYSAIQVVQQTMLMSFGHWCNPCFRKLLVSRKTYSIQ